MDASIPFMGIGSLTDAERIAYEISRGYKARSPSIYLRPTSMCCIRNLPKYLGQADLASEPDNKMLNREKLQDYQGSVRA